MKEKYIEVKIKNVYGNERIYVTDNETAKIITQLTNKLTLSKQDIIAFKKLGLNFRIKQDVLV
jgi:hypothetical protein|tara:strand:- start:170 stop:358 length:189 start_codon:yes stop_codon:yes gene_type:complete